MTALQQLSFTTDDGFSQRACLGLIVLETDQTLEMEARRLPIDGVAWYHARIPMEPEVTPTTLTDMEARLPVAAALLPAAFEFDAIGYGCTSAATLIGEAGVTAGIHAAHPGMPCTNPISAAVDAFGVLGAQRIAVVTPYTAEVTRPVIDLFERHDLTVTAVGSFLESSDLVVARISEASIADGVRQVAAGGDFDAVFVSCTSLRVFGIVDSLEAELGVPVVSSNLALLWRLLRLAGVDDQLKGFGSLFANH
ncbi:MAG: aspartate/glutamate racemase family protein [Actinomycetota bacterium]